MRLVSLVSESGEIDLGDKVRLGAALKGTGLPPVANQWFEGAGDGANYRGTRVLARTLDLPIKFYGKNRAEVWDLFSQVAVAFAPSPTGGQVRLRVNLDGAVWYLDVVRTGGGDWQWDVDSDGDTFLRTIITVQAGDPYWTREDATSQNIVLGGLGRGLIKMPGARLHALRLSTNNSFGEVTINNPGDVAVFPVTTLRGPFSGFGLESPLGEKLEWKGPILAGQWIRIDHGNGTIVDHTGANRYGARVGIPSFWAVPRGDSVATIRVDDATSESSVTMLWNPRKWVLF